MILGTAIAKASDSQIFCEWADETQSSLSETRGFIKNFLREKKFLTSTSNLMNLEKYSIYYTIKKTCVYLTIFQQATNYGHVKEFLSEIEREFEDVRRNTILYKKKPQILTISQYATR